VVPLVCDLRNSQEGEKEILPTTHSLRFFTETREVYRTIWSEAVTKSLTALWLGGVPPEITFHTVIVRLIDNVVERPGRPRWQKYFQRYRHDEQHLYQ